MSDRCEFDSDDDPCGECPFCRPDQPVRHSCRYHSVLVRAEGEGARVILLATSEPSRADVLEQKGES
jgi:hypothetical protein